MNPSRLPARMHFTLEWPVGRPAESALRITDAGRRGAPLAQDDKKIVLQPFIVSSQMVTPHARLSAPSSGGPACR